MKPNAPNEPDYDEKDTGGLLDDLLIKPIQNLPPEERERFQDDMLAHYLEHSHILKANPELHNRLAKQLAERIAKRNQK